VLQELTALRPPGERPFLVAAATSKFRRAIRMRPEFDRACYNLGTVFYSHAIAQQAAEGSTTSAGSDISQVPAAELSVASWTISDTLHDQYFRPHFYNLGTVFYWARHAAQQAEEGSFSSFTSASSDTPQVSQGTCISITPQYYSVLRGIVNVNLPAMQHNGNTQRCLDRLRTVAAPQLLDVRNTAPWRAKREGGATWPVNRRYSHNGPVVNDAAPGERGQFETTLRSLFEKQQVSKFSMSPHHDTARRRAGREGAGGGGRAQRLPAGCAAHHTGAGAAAIQGGVPQVAPGASSQGV